MYVNVLIVIFSVAFIALAIFVVCQMIRDNKNRGSKK
jgi:hypothetical protein